MARFPDIAVCGLVTSPHIGIHRHIGREGGREKNELYRVDEVLRHGSRTRIRTHNRVHERAHKRTHKELIKES